MIKHKIHLLFLSTLLMLVSCANSPSSTTEKMRDAACKAHTEKFFSYIDKDAVSENIKDQFLTQEREKNDSKEDLWGQLGKSIGESILGLMLPALMAQVWGGIERDIEKGKSGQLCRLQIANKDKKTNKVTIETPDGDQMVWGFQKIDDKWTLTSIYDESLLGPVTKPGIKIEELKKEGKEKLDKLLNKGKSYLKAEKYDKAIAAFKEALDIDPTSKDAIQGIEQATKAQGTVDTDAIASSRIVVYDLDAKYYDTDKEHNIPGVRFKLKNRHDKAATKIGVTVYFKDTLGNIIAEETFYPVAADQSSTPTHKPLKPGYIWQMERGKFFDAPRVPDEWKEGRAVAEVTEVEFEN